jgi:hypothetical protein
MVIRMGDRLLINIKNLKKRIKVLQEQLEELEKEDSARRIDIK